MNNTLLIPFIRTLSSKERQSATKWLQSPVHNERQDILQLFQVLDDELFYLGLEPTQERTWQKLFPDQPFSGQQFRLLCSYLYQSLEAWLCWYEWQKQPLHSQTYRLSGLRQRALNKHYHRRARKDARLLDRSPLRHHRYYLHQYEWEHEAYLWQSEQGRAATFNFPEQDEALQIAFMCYKLRLACLAIAHERVSGAHYDIAMLDDILALAQRTPYCDIPAISIYYYVYHMYQQAETDAFEAYQQRLFAHLPHFPEQEKRDLFLFGINFCIKQINKQGAAYFQEALSLYRRGLENNLLDENGWLSAFTFSNIVIIAIRAGELSWAKDFLANYKGQLEPRQREPIVALNAARIAYQEQDHRRALVLLSQFEDKDFFHQFSAKIIQLKIYFELRHFELLAAHIKNTRAYLRRVKHHAYHKQIYHNIFSLTEQLMKLPPYATEKRAKLRQLIINTEPLTEKDWLLRQL